MPCRHVFSWERSLYVVHGVSCYSVDTWMGGWHSLFLALLGQLIHSLSSASFWDGQTGKAENYTGTVSKRSKTNVNMEGFESRAVHQAPTLSFRQVQFAKGFCPLEN